MPDSADSFVEVRRNGIVESLHRISGAVVDAEGSLLTRVGDPTRITYFRSAAKPFQGLPLVTDGVADAFGLTPRELAVCCASHSGEPDHVETVRGLLERIGCSVADLECGAHPPFHQPSAIRLRTSGREPSPLHNNCSGKHTGMLAWSRHREVETAGYRRADHPVQRRILREIVEWVDLPTEEVGTAVDGCGVITFALPLDGMARAYARLGNAARRAPDGPAGRIVAAMTGNPWWVAGSGRLCTDLMEATGGNLLAKGGAEGVFCAADPQRGWGLALKIEDGRKRAVGPATIGLLSRIGLLNEEQLHALDDHAVGAVTNTRGEIVGEVRAVYNIQGGR